MRPSLGASPPNHFHSLHRFDTWGESGVRAGLRRVESTERVEDVEPVETIPESLP